MVLRPRKIMANAKRQVGVGRMEAVTIVGAGGIGCAVGYALRSGGVPVTFLDVDPDKIAWGSAHGVGVDQRPLLPADFQHFAEWSPRPNCIVVLCTKCYDNAAVLARLPPTATLIPIQNGFDPLLEGRHTVEGIASFISECSPGRTHTRITRSGRLHVGHRGAPAQLTPPPREFAEALSPAGLFRVETVADILPFKYTKLLYNAAISPVAAAAGIDNGQLLSVPAARQIFFGLLGENYAILKGAGAPLGTVGPFHPDTVQRILRHRAIARLFAWAFYPSLRGTYCSMSGDLPRGCTEVDYYNGHLIRLAGDRPCPLNKRIYELLKRLEKSRTTLHASALTELAA